MSSTICPKCGTANLPQARFCAQCGGVLTPQPAAGPPMAGTPTCPRCRTPLRTSARFCPTCGYDLMQPPAAGTPPGYQAPAAAPPPAPGAGPAPAPGTPGTVLLSDVQQGGNTLIVRWMGGNTERHPVTKPTMNVGRAPDNDVVMNHPAVSGHHLSLLFTPQGIRITDLNSTNGTQVNGQRIQPNVPTPVNFGDVIKIGDLTGNWVSMGIESPAGEAVRTLSLGKLDLSNLTSVIIGRDPSSYLPLNHPTVSFRHAQIFKQNNTLLIRDLNSTNGTFVNGKRIAQVPLASGDEITIGPFKLVYDAQAQSLAQSMHMGHRIDALKLGREVAKKKMILQNVSLTVNPGEFIALVGGSGAGKTTLMKAMNGYEPANHGNLLLDGEPLYSKIDLYRTQMGYVPQDDIIHRILPVKVALWYAAKLRLPDARPAEIQTRIQEALRAVDMTEHADKPVHVLSGGQRKRVSIAVELLAHPTLFFLDEPTSGLDPGLEKKMMYDLNRLADEGRTVVLVTHATANIEQCDQVAFLSQGRLAFYGPPNDALQFFNVRDFSDIYLKLSQEVDPGRGKPVPPEIQPYYQPKPGAPSKTTAGILWAEHYRRSPHFKQYVADRQSKLKSQASAMAASAPPPRRAKDNFIRQSYYLARRQFDLIRYDWRTLFILLLMMPLIGFLFAMVSNEHDFTGYVGTRVSTPDEVKYHIRRPDQIKEKPEGSVEHTNWKKRVEYIDKDKIEEVKKLWTSDTYKNKPVADKKKLLENGDVKVDYTPSVDADGLITMLALALTQGGTFIAAYEIVKERAIYRRERAVNLSAIAYVLSKVVVLGGFAFIQVISVMIVLQFGVDLGIEGAIFSTGSIELFITLYLGVLASIMFGLFLSAIVPNSDVVLYAILVQLFVQIILGGTLFPMSEDFKWVNKLTISYWVTDGMGSTVDLVQLNNESRTCMASLNQENPDDVNNPTYICSEATRELALDYKHTPEHVIGLWWGTIFQALFYLVLTVIVQARAKGD